MEYERIILELMERIGQLEDRVEKLENRAGEPTAQEEANALQCGKKYRTLKSYLEQNGGIATQKEIEGFLQVSHPTVAGIINRMEQNGFVRCRLDPADKRSKIVSQTERAAAVAQDMHATIQTTEQQMLRSLTPEQIAALESALRTIYADLG